MNSSACLPVAGQLLVSAPRWRPQRKTRAGLPKKQISPRRLPIVNVLTESTDLELGTNAPPFALSDVKTGETVSLEDFEGYQALLVMFICNHCPFVVNVRKELVAIASEYMEKGLGVVAISSNSIETHPQDGPEKMKELAIEEAFPFPYLYDESQQVAKLYKAACTPEFYLFEKRGRRPFTLQYHGQLDDSRPSNGVPVTGNDLRKAITCVLTGQKVDSSQKPSIGCNIKWTPGNEPDYFTKS